MTRPGSGRKFFPPVIRSTAAFAKQVSCSTSNQPENFGLRQILVCRPHSLQSSRSYNARPITAIRSASVHGPVPPSRICGATPQSRAACNASRPPACSSQTRQSATKPGRHLEAHGGVSGLYVCADYPHELPADSLVHALPFGGGEQVPFQGRRLS